MGVNRGDAPIGPMGGLSGVLLLPYSSNINRLFKKAVPFTRET